MLNEFQQKLVLEAREKAQQFRALDVLVEDLHGWLTTVTPVPEDPSPSSGLGVTARMGVLIYI